MTILNSVDIINNMDLPVIIICSVFAICLASISIAAFSFDVGISGFVMGLGLIFAVLAFINIKQPLGYQYTKIEATIDETVSAIEFLDKYEVIDHRGDIYELKYIDPEKIGEKE